MRSMHPLVARFHDQPALVAEDSHSLFTSLLSAVANFDMREIEQAAAASDDFWPAEDDYLAYFRPYVVRDGILMVPVKGVLLHDFPYQLGSWATGYEYILRAIERGMDDGNVRGIALIINSPGGMVAGCFDAADKAIALKEEHGKPVRAYAAEHAYSAAYVWACVGDSINVSRTGGVGSIGVVTMHVDVSSALDQTGYKITFIHAGKHKVDGNPYEPLPADVKARIQERIDELYAIFVDFVAANRPLDADAVRATEALTFSASQAVSNGLADSIGVLDDALAAFAADLSTLHEPGDPEMSTNPDKSAAPAADVNDTQQQHEPAADTSAIDSAQVAADAVAADRARRRDIMALDEAKERPALAGHLADATDMSVEQAKAALAAAGKETVASDANPTPFATHMDGDDQPDIGTSSDASSTQADEDSADNIIAMARKAGLKGFAQDAVAA